MRVVVCISTLFSDWINIPLSFNEIAKQALNSNTHQLSSLFTALFVKNTLSNKVIKKVFYSNSNNSPKQLWAALILVWAAAGFRFFSPTFCGSSSVINAIIVTIYGENVTYLLGTNSVIRRGHWTYLELDLQSSKHQRHSGQDRKGVQSSDVKCIIINAKWNMQKNVIKIASHQLSTWVHVAKSPFVCQSASASLLHSRSEVNG